MRGGVSFLPVHEDGRLFTKSDFGTESDHNHGKTGICDTGFPIIRKADEYAQDGAAPGSAQAGKAQRQTGAYGSCKNLSAKALYLGQNG